MLVHGMGGGAADWNAAVEALAPHARVISYDRRGYGGSEPTEGYEATSALEQGEDLVALIEELAAAPAVLGGADFGALACLHVMVRHAELARAAVLIDPPLFSLVAEATDALTAERVALGEKLAQAGPRAAMEAWLGRPSSAGPRAFFADYAGLATLEVTRRELAAIAQPVAIITSATAPPHVRAAAEALLRVLSTGRRAEDVTAAVRELL